MTLVSEIITDAYRQSNLLAINATPTTSQQTEALRYLNRLVKSVFGNEAGDPLQALPLGRNNIESPTGYPWYGDNPWGEWFVPKNARVVLNIEDPIPLYLTPAPEDGSRFALIDSSGNLSTYPVTIYGNGSRIEGATSLVINTDNYDAEWFYRADTANWMKTSPLALGDTFPFPEEFDFYFIILLAIAINPSYGIAIDPQTQYTFDRAQRQLRARYKQTIPTRSEEALLRLKTDRYYWGRGTLPFNPNFLFDKGWPW